MDLHNDNIVMRCTDCRAVFPIETIREEGGCSECGNIRFKMAYKISDAEEAALAALGYEFKEENWTTDPNYNFGHPKGE